MLSSADRVKAGATLWVAAVVIEHAAVHGWMAKVVDAGFATVIGAVGAVVVPMQFASASALPDAAKKATDEPA